MAPDVDRAVRELDAALPELARAVIGRHLDPSDPANVRFSLDPDGREEHQTQWHQWGIITHTRMFLKHFEEEVPRLLREWGLWESVDSRLQNCIDGVSRWELLRVSILLHDIGTGDGIVQAG